MIIKIIIMGICVCLINLLLRNTMSAYVVIIDILFVVSVAILIMDNTLDTFRNFRDLLNITSTTSKMLTYLYKSAAICILSKIASDICSESGNVSVGSIIDFTSRIMLLIMVAPFIESVMKTAAAFIK